MSSTTTSELAHAANVLGALSLAVVDRIHGAVADAGVDGETSAAALSALHHFLDAPTIGRLRGVVGRTSPATVRMVDRLEAAGYARRRAGDDARASHVELTAKGRRLAAGVTNARQATLEAALAELTPAERRRLAGLLGRVMENVVQTKLARPLDEGTGWTCRLCDPHACGREHGACPAANAARATLDPS